MVTTTPFAYFLCSLPTPLLFPSFHRNPVVTYFVFVYLELHAKADSYFLIVQKIYAYRLLV